MVSNFQQESLLLAEVSSIAVFPSFCPMYLFFFFPNSNQKFFDGFPGDSDSKESDCKAGDMGLSLGWEDPLEKGMATHSSILAWRISGDEGAWWAAVYGVKKSWT